MKQLSLINVFMFFLVYFVFLSQFLFSQSAPAKSLELGNIWVFAFEDEWDSNIQYDSIKVVGDTIIDSYKYAVLRRDGYNDRYQRADSANIYEYSTYSSEEFIKINFNMKDSVSDSYEVHSDTVEFWGKFRKRICITSYGSLSTETNCHMYGLGETSFYSYASMSSDFSKYLVAAIIGGEIYGDSTLVGIHKIKYISPGHYNLFQNYPNPFNPSTVIKYSIPITDNVQVIVYDILGTEVATLVNERKQAGTYETKFIANNLPSGIYFYKISANDFSVVKKMLLLK